MKKLLIMGAIVLIASSSVVRAQQQEPASLQPPASSQSTDNKRKYVLEVYVTPQFGPSYLTVSGPNRTPGFGFYHRYIRTGSEAESGRLPIRGVKVEPQLNGEAVDVRVTLLRGEESYEEEELVHVYQLRLGEENTLTHLRRFGIEPFRVKVVDTVPTLPPIPDFQNFTKSIDIDRVRRLKKPLPAYRMTLRNLSDKPVVALKVEVTNRSGGDRSIYPQDFEGRSLMAAGGTTDVYLTVEVPMRNASTYTPGTATSNTINIRSVVFSDLSFEGEMQRACEFEAEMMGKRLWLKRIIPFMDQELARLNFADQLEAARQFKERVAALRFRFNESERNKVSSVLPDCPKPAKAATYTAGGVNLILIREVERFIEKTPAPANFKSWLEEKRAHYAAWLARP